MAEDKAASEPDFELNNRFASLVVEEPTLGRMISNEAKATKLPSPPSSAAEKGTAYTLKNNDEEKYLAIFCLYEDLNRLRQQICSMWTRYRFGELDLVSVSLATNVALELGTHIETEFLESYADLNTSEKILTALLRILQSLVMDSSALSIHTEEGGYIVGSKILMEWLLITGMTAYRSFWAGEEASKDALVIRGLTNSQEIQQRIQQMASIPCESLGHDEQDVRMWIHLDDLFSVAGEIAILQLQQLDLPMEDLFTQALRTKDRSLSAVLLLRLSRI